MDKVMESGVMGDHGDTVDDTLKQRGSVYGPYEKVVEARAIIMDTLKVHFKRQNNYQMPGDIEMMFNDVVLKLVRAASKPKYTDSWHDLGGYAKLIERVMNDRGNKTTEE